MSPALAGNFFSAEPPGKPQLLNPVNIVFMFSWHIFSVMSGRQGRQVSAEQRRCLSPLCIAHSQALRLLLPPAARRKTTQQCPSLLCLLGAALFLSP